VGYADLLRGLEEEAARQAAALRAEAARESERLVAEARAEAGRLRGEALARARERWEAAAQRRRADAGRDRDRSFLEAARQLLEEARAEALRLLEPRRPDLLPRLLAEAVPAADPGHEIEVVVDPGQQDGTWAWLVQERPGLPVAVRAAAAARGGVEVRWGGVVLDDTLPARLDKAWPDVEGRAAALLLEGTAAGGGDARL
jgi:V/A-type H+-transporting ATPase subunit E